ncbi:uncharacterized protein LOC130880674 isoform X2 [Chionomys nivalis]|uniref:uncharacterized protein LOC130880674 isoform X2 n=1 Tax=Chionomys nivalis TaxID=269649 RepID=UPI002595A704|nr:uncharacterized protein LOC130880674 isoform X2 [Chionomys nivalis]
MKKQGREASQRRWAWKRMEDLDKRSFEGHGRTQQGTLSYLNHKQVLTGGYPSTMVWPCAWGGVRSRRDCHAWLLEKHLSRLPHPTWLQRVRGPLPPALKSSTKELWAAEHHSTGKRGWMVPDAKRGGTGRQQHPRFLCGKLRLEKHAFLLEVSADPASPVIQSHGFIVGVRLINLCTYKLNLIYLHILEGTGTGLFSLKIIPGAPRKDQLLSKLHGGGQTTDFLLAYPGASLADGRGGHAALQTLGWEGRTAKIILMPPPITPKPMQAGKATACQLSFNSLQTPFLRGLEASQIMFLSRKLLPKDEPLAGLGGTSFLLTSA